MQKTSEAIETIEYECSYEDVLNGLKETKSSQLLDKGTYEVVFSWRPSMVNGYNDSGLKYFYHGISWSKITNEEAAAKKAAEEAAAKKAVEEAAAKKAAEEEAARQATEEEAAARKAAEEEAAAQKAAEEEERKEDEAARQAAEEATRKAAEEAARKTAEEEAARKSAEETAIGETVVPSPADTTVWTDRYNDYDYDDSDAAPQTVKSANTLKAKGKTVKVKYAKLKKKAQTISAKKAFSISKAKGKLSYKKVSGNKKISINKKTGKITIKKGLKKGTYKVKVKVTAAGNSNYKEAAKTATVIIRVK